MLKVEELGSERIYLCQLQHKTEKNTVATKMLYGRTQPNIFSAFGEHEISVLFCFWWTLAKPSLLFFHGLTLYCAKHFKEGFSLRFGEALIEMLTLFTK